MSANPPAPRAGHPYYMHDAIYAQPGALRLVTRGQGDAIGAAAARLVELEHVLLTGVGTSWHAAGEFQKIQDELTQTAARLRALQEEITKLQQTPGTTPAQIQAKIASLDQQKKEYTRKGEDARTSYQQRREQLFSPFQEDVGKALDAFAKARNITMVIDGSQVQGVLYAADASDITRAFINDYNARNPATAAVTTPK